MANAAEYKSRVGLDNLYVALVSADSANAYTAATPAYLAPAAEASQEPETSFEVDYADDQPFDVMTGEGATNIKLVVTNIDPQTLALITGRVFDSASGRMWDNGGAAPFCALGFRSRKSTGTYRYYWFLKGKFSMPKEEATTKGETAEPKKLELEFTAIRTVYRWNLGGGITDSIKRIVGDDDTTNFSATGWFSAVQTPSWSAPSALALSTSTPADAASGVSKSADLTLTFNNVMPDGVVNWINLVVNSDGTNVAGTYTLDATKKIVTIDPTSDLTGSTAYAINYNVVDVFGQVLKGVINFTTAA